jgi:hypothetical protein
VKRAMEIDASSAPVKRLQKATRRLRKEQNEHDRKLFSKMLQKSEEIAGTTGGLTRAERAAAEKVDAAQGTKAAQRLSSEQRLEKAKKFLQQPRVQSAKRSAIIKYLQTKCKLTADELDAVLKATHEEQK